MTVQVVALAVFAGIFLVASVRKVNMGILMFVAASGVGLWLAGVGLDEIVAGFPVDILVLLVGVTYFFGIAQVNGTIDRVVDGALAKLGGRAALLPLVFFVLTGGVAAMGSPLGALIMAPVGMQTAMKRGVDPMLMALAIGTGLSAGAFAPTSLFGIVTYSTAHSAGIRLSPIVLFAVALVANLMLLLCAFFLFGGRALLRGTVAQTQLTRLETRVTASVGADAPTSTGPAANGTSPLSGEAAAGTYDDRPAPFTTGQVITIACMVGLVLTVVVMSGLGLEPDIGVLCFGFAAALMLIDPVAGKKAIGKIDWSTVLLVGGVITYVGVLQTMGAVDLLGEFAGSIGTPILAAVTLCLIGGLISAFASTTGMLAALVPLALPLVSSGDLPGWAVISALGVCASIVDVSPFSTVGATLVATTVDESERPRMTRLLMRWGLSMVAIGPVGLVGILVVPGMLL
jgi:di/tricarboxylate transporter